MNETRERAAWVEIGERRPFLVSLVFPRSSIAYLSAQRTIGRKWPYATLFGSRLLVLGILGAVVLGVWHWGLPVPLWELELAGVVLVAVIVLGWVWKNRYRWLS
jgi:hypothetical protein